MFPFPGPRDRLLEMSCLCDPSLDLSLHFWEVGCLLILTLTMEYRETQTTILILTTVLSPTPTQYLSLSLISVTSNFCIRKKCLKNWNDGIPWTCSMNLSLPRKPKQSRPKELDPYSVNILMLTCSSNCYFS